MARISTGRAQEQQSHREEDRHGQVLRVQTAPRAAGGARPRRGERKEGAGLLAEGRLQSFNPSRRCLRDDGGT